MTWHLKDRELEKKLIEIDPDFVKTLTEWVEEKITNNWFNKDSITEAELKYNGVYLGTVRFLTHELEEVPEYNPNAWNEYPKVMPIHGIYRLEVCHSLGSPIRLYAACFDFYSDKGWYEYGNGKYINTDVTDGYVRFRPWKV